MSRVLTITVHFTSGRQFTFSMDEDAPGAGAGSNERQVSYDLGTDLPAYSFPLANIEFLEVVPCP